MIAANFGTNNAQLFQTRQNPEAYAKTYAQKNGISLEEAREELKSKYGDPGQGMGNVSIFSNQASENSYYDINSSNFDFADFDFNENAFGGFGQNMQMPYQNGGIKGLFQKLLDAFKGGAGPKNEGDPQSHINPETNAQSGPVKQGDFNPKQGANIGGRKDPDEMAQEYAEVNNISLDEAKKQLKELYGEPQQK